MRPKADTRTRDRLLFYLKTRGPQTAAQLARRLKVTPMAVRQHLYALEASNRVDSSDQRQPVGRPARLWSISAGAQKDFPEGYADLAVELLGAVRSTFGAKGVERLVADRTEQQIRDYRARLPDVSAPLTDRVSALVRLRTEEGYMAEWTRSRDGSLALVENHCPICAAAEICQALCAGELRLFQEVLGPDVRILREEHLLEGSRRCLYRLQPVGPDTVT